MKAAIAERIGMGMTIAGLMTMPLIATIHLAVIWHVLALVVALSLVLMGGRMARRARRERDAGASRPL